MKIRPCSKKHPSFADSYLGFATFIIALLAICFCILFYTMSPKTFEFRDSIYGSILEYALAFCLSVYLSFTPRINMFKAGKALVVGLPTLFLLLDLLNIGKISFLILFLYSVLNVSVSIYNYLKTEKEYKSVWLFGAFAFIVSIAPCLRVKTIDTSFPFWKPALVVCLIAFAVTLTVFIRRYLRIRDPENLIAAPLLALLAGFALTFLTLSSGNVVLDRSEPTYETFEIVDKHISAGARQVTTFNVLVENDSVDFSITISERHYREYEIGDEITLSIYSGAFGVRYYIHESNIKDLNGEK